MWLGTEVEIERHGMGEEDQGCWFGFLRNFVGGSSLGCGNQVNEVSEDGLKVVCERSALCVDLFRMVDSSGGFGMPWKELHEVDDVEMMMMMM